MKALVHSDRLNNEHYGLWWVDPEHGLLKNLYLDDTGPEAARGRVIVYEKSPEITWSEWFDILTSRSPYFESWAVYDNAGLSPRQMLASLMEPDAPPLTTAK